MPIRLFNSLTRQTEPLATHEPGLVRMYHCGPTVYSSPHIGNFRSFLLADFLRRTLEDQGYRVRQVMNVTDVGHMTGDDEDRGEDRMEIAARREQLDPWAIARKYEAEFKDYLAKLHFRMPDVIPRATEHIAEMGAIIDDLLKRGYAYQVNGNVYFEIARFPEYGKLSKKVLDDLEEGYRVEVRGEKKSGKDFALWKVDKKHIMQWDAPFAGGARGFPGWHIECSAMAMKHLGPVLDIHTGGEDNMFPHHECEIAQSESHTGKPFASMWLHVKHLMVEGQKMAKSQGNFTTVAQILEKGYSGLELRYALMRVHYRQTLNFTMAGLDEARVALQRVEGARRRLVRIRDGVHPAGTQELTAPLAALHERFTTAICDDLNVSGALAIAFELVTKANKSLPSERGAGAALELFDRMEAVLGCFGSTPIDADAGVSPHLQALLDRRQAARQAKDFATSDRIRDELTRSGYKIVDTPHGPRLEQL